jgi:hypothetical protein
MPLWRIRITMPDDPHSRALLDQALDGQRVTELNFTPREADAAQVAGDVVLELPRDEDLSPMLSALHRISSRVFVSRADDAPAPARAPAMTSSLVRTNGFAPQAPSSFAAAD